MYLTIMRAIRFILILWLLVPSLSSAVSCSYETHSFQWRPWGYEVRADCTCDTFHFPLVITFDEEPGYGELNSAFTVRMNKLKDDLENPPAPPDPWYSETDVEEIIIQKCYLEEGQDLSELPDSCP